VANVVVISGTPGTGKTTIAKQLASSIDGKYVSIGQYVAKHKLFLGVDRRRKTKIVNLEATRRSLGRHLTASKGWIVVDTHIPEGIVPAKSVRLVTILRCHPRILEARLHTKKWNQTKIRENVLAEILDSCFLAAVKYYGARKVAQIDTSKSTVQGSVTMIKGTILGKRSTRGMKVDWLSRLEKEGLLDRYLK